MKNTNELAQRLQNLDAEELVAEFRKRLFTSTPKGHYLALRYDAEEGKILWEEEPNPIRLRDTKTVRTLLSERAPVEDPGPSDGEWVEVDNRKAAKYCYPRGSKTPWEDWSLVSDVDWGTENEKDWRFFNASWVPADGWIADNDWEVNQVQRLLEHWAKELE